jgi:hypothetical protein
MPTGRGLSGQATVTLVQGPGTPRGRSESGAGGGAGGAGRGYPRREGSA